MSNFTGEITIDPPLTWPEIQQAQQLEHVAEWEVRLEVTEEKKNTPEGVLVRRTCSAIVPWKADYKGYFVQEALQGIVDLFHETHSFSGFIEERMEGWPDMFRYVVRGSTAHKIKGEITWPEPE